MMRTAQARSLRSTTCARAVATLALLGVWTLAACSSDNAASAANTGDGSTPSTAQAFNGDCTTANWTGVSAECWSCMCGKCQSQLSACNEDCMAAMQCGLDNHVLVGSAAEISCEIRAFTATCEQDPASQAQASAILAFDGCLINSHKAPEHLRGCESECGTTYTGDVCTRFPADAGTSGD